MGVRGSNIGIGGVLIVGGVAGSCGVVGSVGGSKLLLDVFGYAAYSVDLVGL